GNRGNSLVMDKLNLLDERKKQAEVELVELEEKLTKAKARSMDAGRFKQILAGFGEKFHNLGFLEKQRLVRLVVQRIDFDKVENKIRLILYPLAGKGQAGMG